jgi:hypothetical protein
MAMVFAFRALRVKAYQNDRIEPGVHGNVDCLISTVAAVGDKPRRCVYPSGSFDVNQL